MTLAEKFNLFIKKHLKLPPNAQEVGVFLYAAERAEDIATLTTYLDAFGGRIVQKKDSDSVTALIWAAYRGNTEGVKKLLAAGARINEGDSVNGTALLYAAAEGHTPCVEALLAAHTDMERSNTHGMTPFLKAVSRGHVDCMILLMDAGANVDARCHEGNGLAYYAGLNETPHLAEIVESRKRGKTQHAISADIAVFSQGTQENIVIKGGGLKLRKPSTSI